MGIGPEPDSLEGDRGCGRDGAHLGRRLDLQLGSLREPGAGLQWAVTASDPACW